MNDDVPNSDPSAVATPVPPASVLLDFPVVGIGASAGCVAALVELFRHMPERPGMAFAVVVHLSPRHDSALDGIVANVTSMPVQQVQGSVDIRPDHVYLAPPAAALTIDGGRLVAGPIEPDQGRSVSIDVFFRHLAEAQRERAICIVLSGTGADGSVGLRRIKENGGVTLAQRPDEAEYGGMPSNAIATDAIDFVLPVTKMGARLVELWANMRRIELPRPAEDSLKVSSPAPGRAEALAEQALGEIMALLRSRTGHDFGHYKRAIVLRRLERRLQVNGVPDLPSYRDLLEGRPDEAPALLKDLLISVTNFFRDRNAFDALDAELGKLLHRRTGSTGRLRAWSAGCATGEEAYSVAMLLTEKTVRLGLDLDVQVFASDIDERAIAVARAGLYPDTVITDVAPSRLRQFFQKEEAQVRVRKELRERLVFAVHNVLRDPPFSQLDLVSCRNLLIYLDREVQQQVLEIFHFALRPGGLLFLGNSEGIDGIDALAGLFVPVDEKHRIYRADGLRRGTRQPPMPSRDALPPLVAPYRKPEARTLLASLHERAREAVGPASVLVDEDSNILHSTGRASTFLRFVAGPPSQNLLDAVRVDLRLELRAALIQAWRDRKSVQARRVRVREAASQTVWVSMAVHPVDDPGVALVLVVFDQTDTALDGEARGNDTPDPVQVLLEEELRRTREELRGTLGESAQSSEELRASNVELQAINEELHSTTEELETSKEELLSVNEELVTVNQELKAKVDETSRVNDDLKNLIASTDLATVFVDRDMRVKRFTPSASRLFNLIGSDVGRSLLDITHRLDYPRLEEDAMQAFRSLGVIEREVRGDKGGIFLVRVRPYRTHEDVIDGAALTFVDITATRRAEERLIVGEANLRLVAESTRDFAIIALDVQGEVTAWNAGAQRIFGFAENEVVGRPVDLIYTAEDRAAGVPQREMRTALADGRALDERWHVAKDGDSFYCSGIMTPMFEQGAHVGFSKIARDLTVAKRAESQLEALLLQEKETRAELQRAIQLKDEFLAVMSHELKQPLNLIHVNAELMSRLPEVRQAPPVARAADVIRRAVLSQAKIIDDLLDLSRLRTGKLGLAVGRVDWTATVTKVLDAVEGDVSAQRLTLTREFDTVPVSILADPIRVEQIVWNLVGNALKFTPAGGAIAVRLVEEGDLARLDVVDTGVGIGPEFIADVFDMFRQADRSTTRPQGGMGIGLALVRQLAEAQGGKVAVESAGKGLGAHFSVWLPLLDAAASDGDRHPAAQPALRGRRILAVDDTADVLDSFATLLRLEGGEVTAVRSGPEAVAALGEASFDILLSDVAMPGMDGYELIAAVRADPRTAVLPAVALTGFGRPQDERRALAAGFDAHLAKPIVIDELLHTVAELLDGRRGRGG